VKHRHLLPEEFDLLLDDEVGFGVAPLRDHLAGCADCRAQFDEARQVAVALEGLPHLAPTFGMADRVMAQVPVFVPWHVAARDTAVRWLPQSRPARVIVGGLMTVAGATLTAGVVWLASRGDLVAFATEVTATRVRPVVAGALQNGAVALLGPGVMESLEHGGLTELGVVASGFALAALASAFGLRAIAAAARRRN
jgi:hypothetical protein